MDFFPCRKGASQPASIQPHQSLLHLAALLPQCNVVTSRLPWEWERGLKGFRKNIFVIAWRILIITQRAVFPHHETCSLECGFDLPWLLSAFCQRPEPLVHTTVSCIQFTMTHILQCDHFSNFYSRSVGLTQRMTMGNFVLFHHWQTI